MHNSKNWLLGKHSQFWSNEADFQAILYTHEVVTLTKFRDDWPKNVDFFLLVNFGDCTLFLLAL